MDPRTEERWRTALEQRGKHEMQTELDMRPGQPSDLLFTVGTEAPFPTREFCEQWCRGNRERTFAMSGLTFAALATTLLIVLCGLAASGSWSSNERTGFTGPMPVRAGPPPPQGGWGAAGSTSSSNTSSSTAGAPAGKSSANAGCTSVSASGSLHTVQAEQTCQQMRATHRAMP